MSNPTFLEILSMNNEFEERISPHINSCEAYYTCVPITIDLFNNNENEVKRSIRNALTTIYYEPVRQQFIIGLFNYIRNYRDRKLRECAEQVEIEDICHVEIEDSRPVSQEIQIYKEYIKKFNLIWQEARIYWSDNMRYRRLSLANNNHKNYTELFKIIAPWIYDEYKEGAPKYTPKERVFKRLHTLTGPYCFLCLMICPSFLQHVFYKISMKLDKFLLMMSETLNDQAIDPNEVLAFIGNTSTHLSNYRIKSGNIGTSGTYFKLKYNSNDDIELANRCTSGPKYDEIEKSCIVCLIETEDLYRYCIGDYHQKINCACYMCDSCYESVVSQARLRSRDLECFYCRRKALSSHLIIRDLSETNNINELITFIDNNKDTYNKITILNFISYI